jgi:NAD(P)-dependent dehydrogenase (short-subunit alcohol dehydrogenase family)
MTTLIIGGHSGIGREIKLGLRRRRPAVIAPSQGTFDITCGAHEMRNWLVEEGVKYDVVIYSAGVQHLGFIGELDEDEVAHIYRVNVLGFIHLLDALRWHQGTHPTNILAIVSDASRVAMRGSIAYCSSKAALAHAVRCAARELAPEWRVNGLSPGVVDGTGMTAYVDSVVPAIRGWSAEQARDYERSMIPMGRRATTQEVADAAYGILAGPKYMTGSVIEMTGGR